MNYSQLVTAVQDYVENQFQTTDIDNFIKQAEQRIYNTVQFPSLRKNVTGTLTSGNKYLSCPNDFLATYSLAVISAGGSYTYLLPKDVSFLREAYPDPASTSTPKYYAIFGPQSSNPTELTFIVGPTPNASLSVELHYYYYPESIVTAGTSWVGDNIDSVLLYGTLVEAYTFMKGEPDMVGLYDGKYKEAMALAKRLGDGMERGDAYRYGQAAYPVE
jgi:hypothetical protein